MTTVDAHAVQAFTFPAPGKPLNANQRLHHMERARRTKTWRDAAHLHARAAKLPAVTSRVHITVTVAFPDNRHRDIGNWYPTGKAIVDGLRDAAVLEDDDDTRITGPDLRRGERTTSPVPVVTVTLTPVEAPCSR